VGAGKGRYDIAGQRHVARADKSSAAALQYSTCELAAIDGASSTAARLAELKAMQAGLSTAIQAESNGPYLVTNGESLFNWLGERISLRPLTALCRCGQSAIKPFCDGTHQVGELPSATTLLLAVAMTLRFSDNDSEDAIDYFLDIIARFHALGHMELQNDAEGSCSRHTYCAKFGASPAVECAARHIEG
jgi:CDGSH-type Zn-finger protein